MRSLIRILAIAAVAFLVACGASVHHVSATNSAKPTTTPASTGNPYYPLTDGTHFAYSITKIATAHWDSDAKEVVIDTRSPEPNPLGSTLVMRYSTGKCSAFGDQTFFFAEYNFGNTTQPATGPLVRANTLGDIVATSSSGIRYIGEQVEGTYATQSQAEPLITMQPVAGEEIHETSIVTHGCDDQSVRESDFGLDYYTVRHLDRWGRFADVWQTSLVERHVGGPPPIYYSYFFVRESATQQGGMVGFSCWSDRVDYFSCGNEYQAVEP